MHMITLVVLALAIYGKAAHGLSQELRDHALKIHNDYRKNVRGACQMERMQYDMDLERQATEWANRCMFKHEMIKGRGENLAWNSAKDAEDVMMTNAAQSWYDEVNMYSYGQSSCGMACHYTQLVWATTNKVGCATNRCTPLQGAYSDAWYFVCFYLPGGNMYGEKPYQTSCTTPCKEGQTEDSEGLCVAGEGNEENGGEEEEEEEEEPTEGENEENSGGDEEGSTGEEVCEDKDSRCEEWGKVGECTKNPDFMHRDCRKACAICGDECKDVHGKCAAWAKDSQCIKNPHYMHQYCKLSCNEC